MTEPMHMLIASQGYHNAEVWLDGEKVGARAVRACVPVTPGETALGWVELCDLSDDGQFFCRDGAVARHIEHGLVSWEQIERREGQ